MEDQSAQGARQPPEALQGHNTRLSLVNTLNTVISLVREIEAVPDLWSLVEWADWLTPTDLNEKGNRRFDTMFYLASLHEVPVTVRDELEVTASQWTDPASCLQLYYDRQLWLAPPQA